MDNQYTATRGILQGQISEKFGEEAADAVEVEIDGGKRDAEAFRHFHLREVGMFEHVDEDIGSDGKESSDEVGCGVIFFEIVSGFADDFVRI